MGFLRRHILDYREQLERILIDNFAVAGYNRKIRIRWNYQTVLILFLLLRKINGYTVKVNLLISIRDNFLNVT